MLELLKLLYYDIKDKYGRLNYLFFFLRGIPGGFGERLRIKVFSPYFAHCGAGVTINQNVNFRGIHKLSVGDRANLGFGCFIQASGGVNIGEDVLLGNDVKIWSVNHIYQNTNLPIFEQGYDEKEVTIGRNCWLGANVVVLPGVNLPEGCVVSAGSVVGVKNYPPFSLIAGNPARVIGNRL